MSNTQRRKESFCTPFKNNSKGAHRMWLRKRMWFLRKKIRNTTHKLMVNTNIMLGELLNFKCNQYMFHLTKFAYQLLERNLHTIVEVHQRKCTEPLICHCGSQPNFQPSHFTEKSLNTGSCDWKSQKMNANNFCVWV